MWAELYFMQNQQVTDAESHSAFVSENRHARIACVENTSLCPLREVFPAKRERTKDQTKERTNEVRRKSLKTK